MRIVFVRHGHPNYEKDCLTELGHRQAAAAAERLRHEGVEKIYSSTCGRAFETAQHLGDVIGLPVEGCDFMREISWGDVDGKPYENGHGLLRQGRFRCGRMAGGAGLCPGGAVLPGEAGSAQSHRCLRSWR